MFIYYIILYIVIITRLLCLPGQGRRHRPAVWCIHTHDWLGQIIFIIHPQWLIRYNIVIFGPFLCSDNSRTFFFFLIFFILSPMPGVYYTHMRVVLSLHWIKYTDLLVCGYTFQKKKNITKQKPKYNNPTIYLTLFPSEFGITQKVLISVDIIGPLRNSQVNKQN